MIINSKAVSLTEAATMLGMTEVEVLRLAQYGYLEQSKPEDGKTRVSLHSLERYAHRNGTALQEVPKPSVGLAGSFTVAETMTKLSLRTEVAVHRLMQAGKLSARMDKGTYKVDAGSVRNYILGA
ncbi:hypothetical protein SAMN04488542_11893 [Fontibacillus panacisegetis]|uniref:Helix-turn-helix domain-containing protein n=1 Tax=Fontibacillus panacisegetis TaxID=670482 RepID=A0A1G7PG13_9BACL|nr:hypothetical protein [Fontibacillus panacisegetis]SDF85266.1 hypothetical protein SAMN04488542_11893 [Fontibacillus panacisegetis]